MNPGWQTKNHIIPWRLFWILCYDMGTVMAWEGIQGAYTVAHGTAVAQGSPAARRLTNDVLRRAFPDG